ncbi:MAG: sulfatase [Hadesarchaea archaeon]|nr:sulfatase [Hadesarchaea archaeon]
MSDPNIVFIVIDALRPDRVGFYNNQKKSFTPNIDELAQTGVAFKNNFACINVTDPSLTSIFSGKYPKSHGLKNHGAKVTSEDLNRLKASETKFLPEILREENYATLGVDWLGRWHKRGYDYYSGLQSAILKITKMFLRDPTKIINLIKLLYIYRKEIPELRVLYDEATTSHAKELIQKFQNQKFFLFVHYWGTHAPYITPTTKTSESSSQNEKESKNILDIDPNREKYHLRWFDDETSINEIISRYDGAVNFADKQVGEIIKELEELGLRENTLIVLTSDHGESLKEHGIYFDHHGLYDESLYTPLIFNGPNLPEGRCVNGITQHTEIVPTILDYLDYDWDDLDIDGKTTIPNIEGEKEEVREVIYAEEREAERKNAIRTKGYKYIFAKNQAVAKCGYCDCLHGSVKELYDLKEDPKETKNILDDNEEKANELERDFLEWKRETEKDKLEIMRIKKKVNNLKSKKSI